MRTPQSLFWALGPTGLALIAGLVRWLAQGSGNTFTAMSRRYYVPDSLLGWRVVHDGPVWLGLDVLAILFGVLVAVAIAAWWLRGYEKKRGERWSRGRGGLWLVAIAPLAVPLWAWTTGFGPGDARDRLPVADGEKVAVAPSGTTGRLEGAPSGRYRVVENVGSAVTAQLSASGEAFDTRFTGNIGGHLSLDTGDLSRPVTLEVSVDAASVDTGVAMRSKHATEYLKVEEFPELSFKLIQLLASQQGESDAEIQFWGRGVIEMMGQPIEVTVIGTAQMLDAAGLTQLQVSGPALLIKGDFAIDLRETGLAEDIGDFDTPDVPINVSLVLVHTTEEG